MVQNRAPWLLQLLGQIEADLDINVLFWENSDAREAGYARSIDVKVGPKHSQTELASHRLGSGVCPGGAI